jgi:hypothetical protein
MFRRMLAALVLLTGAAGSADAAESYFSGVARVTNLATGSVSSEPMALERAAGDDSLVETACVQTGKGPGRASTIYARISDGKLQVSDAPTGHVMLTGAGEADGPPGAWTHLHFVMDYAIPGSPIHIDDHNYLAGGKLIARKLITTAAGRPVQLWEADLEPVSQDELRRRWAVLTCPAVPRVN